VARGARYYQPIEGSARLATAPLSASPELARAEALAAGDMRRVSFEGELVGAARVAGRCAAIPLDAFDSAGEHLEPEEQGAYFQLLRLSYAEGRNFCRVAKRELVTRLGTSERRLHRIMDGLVRKGFIRLLHRDNRGTAFRVYLPREAAREGGDGFALTAISASGSARTDSSRAPEPSPPATSRPLPSRPPIPLGDARTRSLAAALAEARGSAGDEAIAAALREVSELVADGGTPRQVEAAIRAVARRRAQGGVTP
jgi:hypothetical protein